MENRKKSDSIISNVMWKLAERILAQLASLVVSIILARLLLPSDYGAISMVIVFITIANVFVTEGIPNALIQKKDADEVDFSSVFFVNLILSIILYLILFIVAPYISSFYGFEILCPVVRIMGLRIIIGAVNSVQHAYVSRHMMFRKYFWSTLLGTVLSGMIGIIMAYNGFGIWALVLQYMINVSVDTIVLFCTVNWMPKLLFSFDRVISHIRFGWKMLFEAVSNTLMEQLQNLIVGKVYSSSDLAYYTRGQQFPNLIVANITSSIGSVLFPAMANEQDEMCRVTLLLRKSSKISYYVVFPILMGMAMVAEPFVRLILTEKWMETVPYMQMFCFFFAINVFLIPRHQALNGIGRSDVYMLEHFISRIIQIIILILTFRISIFAMLLGSILSKIFLCIIVSYTSQKYSLYKYKDQLIDMIPSVIGCIVMGIPTYFISKLGFTNGMTLIIQCVLGILIYVGYSAIFKLEEFQICKQYLVMIKNKIR